MHNDKVPPYDLDAEEATLGSILVDQEAIFKVSSFLDSEDL